jgi:hypothetical protein
LDKYRYYWYLAFTAERSKGEDMIPVQYRDPQTEEILERRYEEGAPAIGTRLRIGFDEYRVLYRWRCVPTSCIVYVHRVPREGRRAVRTAA